MEITGNLAQKQGLLVRPIKGQIMPGEHLDCEVSIGRTVLLFADKLSLKVKLKKKSVHRSHEETLTLGQFVGACMGGVPPQFIVS